MKQVFMNNPVHSLHKFVEFITMGSEANLKFMLNDKDTSVAYQSLRDGHTSHIVSIATRSMSINQHADVSTKRCYYSRRLDMLEMKRREILESREW